MAALRRRVADLRTYLDAEDERRRTLGGAAASSSSLDFETFDDADETAARLFAAVNAQSAVARVTEARVEALAEAGHVRQATDA